MNDVTYATMATDFGLAIRRTNSDGRVWWVPETPGNRHYDEYLEWLAEGNEPEVIENV